MAEANPSKNGIPYLKTKQKLKAKRAEPVAQVAKHLPTKCEVPNSNHNTAKKNIFLKMLPFHSEIPS
jgi:hypothetical protein